MANRPFLSAATGEEFMTDDTPLTRSVADVEHVSERRVNNAAPWAQDQGYCG